LKFVNIDIVMLFYIIILLWKGGRVVNCTNFENWRGFAVTVGSNPSLSVFYNLKTIFLKSKGFNSFTCNFFVFCVQNAVNEKAVKKRQKDA
jgi:hypothetical protein